MKNYIIPIFVPQYGCKHQCVFCDQKKITGHSAPVTPESVQEVIRKTLDGIRPGRRVEVAFYGGSFTALSLTAQSALLTPACDALQAGKIHAIRLSTRPDAITESILANLTRLRVSIIELGVQSLDERVLAKSGRGHDAAAVAHASDLILKAGFTLGLQLMPGLPGENWASLILTARRALIARPHFIRIYPAVVIAGTALADLYEQGVYEPLSLSGAVSRAAYLKLLFERENIPVIRTGLQATDELNLPGTVIKGPYHPAFGEMVDAYIFYLMLTHFFETGQRQNFADKFVIRHHPKDASKVRGVNLSNIKNLRNNYGIRKIYLQQDAPKIGELIIEHAYQKYTLTRGLINLI